MGLPSKEDDVLELFFNEPTKHWHFKDIVAETEMSQDRVNHWLKRFIKEDLIKHIRPEGKMPFFTGNYEHPNYEHKKKLYGFDKMLKTGLLSKLQSLKNAKTVVIFGSFARGDWNANSDVDVFVLGDPEDLKYGTVWKSFGREVQIHAFKTRKDIKDIQSGLMHNVVQGYFIKGSIHDLVEVSV
ncbi:MAG: nucleotidyltransferase domain-containing protein [archaeon]